MKNTCKLILLGLIVSVVPACDDFLEEDIVSGITDESHYTIASGWEDGVKATYNPLRDWFGQEPGHNMTVFGTDLFLPGINRNWAGINNYLDQMNATNGHFEAMWNSFYEGINTANAVITFADQNSLDQETKNVRLGEVRFLRAFYYYLLVENWGAVHLTTEYTTGVETSANRTDPENIYNDLIVPDLQFAIDNLPATQDEYGRITRGAAEAMMAKVQLTMGWYADRGEFGGAADSHFQNALNAADNVINNYSYSLLGDFADVFDINNQVHDEVIWAVQYTQDPLTNGGGNESHLFYICDYDGEPGLDRSIEYGRRFRRYRPTRYLLTLFDTESDSRYDKTFMTVWIANKNDVSPKTGEPIVAGVDTALYVTNFAVPEEEQLAAKYIFRDLPPEGEENDLAIDVRYYPSCYKKHIDPLRPTINERAGSRDFYALRLADIYLIAAEAGFKLGQAVAEAYINPVRRRAAWPGQEADMEVTDAEVDLDFILDERARELVSEQHRWLDLKRTGTLLERATTYNEEAAPNIQPFHRLRPIPQPQLDATSNEDFNQNIGYTAN